MDDKKGLFLDRDGTIINDCEGVLYEKDIKFEYYFVSSFATT